MRDIDIARRLTQQWAETVADADYDCRPPRVRPTASEPAHGARQHSFQDAVAANEVVIERSAYMNQNEKDHKPAHPAVDRE